MKNVVLYRSSFRQPEETGLVMNTTRIEKIVLNGINIEQAVQISHTTVENVDEFEYLHSLTAWDNNCSEEIKKRIGKATDAITSLKHIWNENNVTIRNKFRILTTCVPSVLLHMSQKYGPLKKAIRIRNETLLPKNSNNQLKGHD